MEDFAKQQSLVASMQASNKQKTLELERYEQEIGHKEQELQRMLMGVS